MDKITFICPCYNHEKYVIDFLNSLVAQTNPNWELIIWDDCSTDKSVERIQSVRDKRIRLIKNEYNRGLTFALSSGIRLAKNQIISFVASDDILYPNYVEKMLKVFREKPNISACYTPLRFMSHDGKLLPQMVSLHRNKKPETLFADIFLNANLLTSPGMAFRKEVIQPYLPLDIGLIQYSDWQLHFFILLKHPIEMLKDPLVKYRVSPGSASARSDATILREQIEMKKLMDTVVQLIGKDTALFEKFFGSYPQVKGQKILPQTIPFWLGRLALTSSLQIKQEWGLQTIMDFIATEENMTLLHKLYGFSYKDYMMMAKGIVPISKCSPLETKIKKYRKKVKRQKYIILGLIFALVVVAIWGCR